MDKRYKLIKDVHWAKAGSVVEYNEERGRYEIIEVVHQKALLDVGYDPAGDSCVDRTVVENMPEFFMPLEPLFVPANQVERVKKFVSKLK